MSKEMFTDELYCFLFESQDHQAWEMWNSIWLGKGTRRVYQVPKTDTNPDMFAITLAYLNTNSDLGLEEGLQEEPDIPRTLPDILRVKWYDKHSEMVERFATRENGKWVEIPRPEEFIPIWDRGRTSKKNTFYGEKAHTMLGNKPAVKELITKAEDSQSTGMKEQPNKSKDSSKELNPFENTLSFSDQEELPEMDGFLSELDQVDKNQTSLL